MKNNELQGRTRSFALQAIRLVEALPRCQTAAVLGRQLMRSATSVGANYRSARRAKSPADFIAKMALVEEEADESQYWLELIVESGLLSTNDVKNLAAEAGELVAIAVASIKTARGFKNKKSG